jgi:hypothetical protein
MPEWHCPGRGAGRSRGRAQDPPLAGVLCAVEPDKREERPDKPPGQFMEEAHEADTKRFVEQARELARRRAQERPAWDEDERG